MIRFTELNIILINKDKNTPINEKVYLLAIQGSRLFFCTTYINIFWVSNKSSYRGTTKKVGRLLDHNTVLVLKKEFIACLYIGKLNYVKKILFDIFP